MRELLIVRFQSLSSAGCTQVKFLTLTGAVRQGVCGEKLKSKKEILTGNTGGVCDKNLRLLPIENHKNV